MAYDEDLAHTHDQGYGAFATEAAGVIAGWIRPHSGRVVDLGCGGGQSSRVFADAGFDVLGIDNSAPLIERARARVPEAEFRVGSFLDRDLPAGCAAVVAISEVFTYTFDERNGRAALADLFARIHAALRPGGLLAFDLLGPTGEEEPTRSWQEGEDWAVLAERSVSGRRLRRHIVTFRDTGDGAWRRSVETHHVLLFDPAEVLEDLLAAGFRAKRRRSYTGPRYQRGHSVYVARRH